MRAIGLHIILIVCLLAPLLSIAKTKSEKRYEIDAKRIGIEYSSENALVRSREFKRIDSSYYVGWMFEGTYRYERAADYLGFKLAAEQLQKSIDLLYRDFKKEITTRTSDIMTFYPMYELHRDFDYIAYTLMNAYSNMERPDLVWQHLRFCQKVNLQDEQYSDTYNYLAWTVHRNRFYTSSKFSFLKNSIEENEIYAEELLDSAVWKIRQDAKLNDQLFSGNHYDNSIHSVWHYKSIIYSYGLEIEKARKYYNNLKPTYYFPENNYATFNAIQGKFKQAKKYYDIAKSQDQGDKRMKESFYYSSILNAYSATPKEGIQEMKDIISANGTTPGFGWYNIGLARDLCYDGQLDAAKKYIIRAEQFKEIHRGTTLGQSHYDFSVALIQLMIKEKKINQIKFMNKGWWYSLSDLASLTQLTTEKYALQFLIINQLASNPERELVVYKLFSTENTVSFDEIWYLVKDFSTNFFLKKYQEFAQTDERPLIRNYYNYFAGKLYLEKAEYTTALKYFNQALSKDNIDPAAEKLFLSRIHLAQAQCYKKLDKDALSAEHLIKAYAIYPQLIPYCGMKLKMKMNAQASSKTEKEILSLLKERKINWTTQGNNCVETSISFGHIDAYNTITYQTVVGKNIIVKEQTFSYKDAEDAANKLSLYLFNIGDEEKNFNMSDVKLYSFSGSQMLNNLAKK